MTTQQTWNQQEAATVALFVLESTGPERERALSKFQRFAGNFSGISQGEALWAVQAYGGLDEHGRLNERGRGNALSILSNSGNFLGLY